MVHVYTGDGKGKTTAAIGLAFRAAGYGRRTLFIQFMKKQRSGEHLTAGSFNSLIVFEQFGREEFYIPDKNLPCGKTMDDGTSPSPGKKLPGNLFAGDALAGLARAEEAFSSLREDDGTQYDIIVLDEVLNLVSLGLIEEKAVLDFLMRHRDADKEIVLTGRGATEKIIEAADIATDMRMLKHCWREGTKAREGIDF